MTNLNAAFVEIALRAIEIRDLFEQSPSVRTEATPLKREPLRTMGSTTSISVDGLRLRLETVAGADISKDDVIVVPYGGRSLGR